MKNTESDRNNRKLVDRLTKPGKESVIGLLATTYGIQTEFIEADFLPSVLGLGAWDDRSWAGTIELEKGLASMESATFFIDASAYRGRPRSLRLRIVPLAREMGGLLHAKIVLLVYDSAVKLIVGSANLTQPGYRENLEAAAVLTASKQEPRYASLIASALTGMPGILGEAWKPEAGKVLDLAHRRLSKWKFSGENRHEAFVWSGGPEPLWLTFLKQWPLPEPIHAVTIVSPSWSDDEKQPMLSQFLRSLKARDLLESGASIRLLTEATCVEKDLHRPTLPACFGRVRPHDFGVTVSAQAVDPRVSKEEVDMEGFSKARPLHAKIVLFEGPDTSLLYLGSANFTRRGWGLLKDPGRANIEAGIILRRKGGARRAVREIIPRTAGAAVDLSEDRPGFVVRPEPSEEFLPWPVFIDDILLTPSTHGKGGLDLLIRLRPEKIKGRWSMELPGSGGEPRRVLCDSGQEEIKADRRRLELSTELLNTILLAREVIVKWWRCAGGRAVPINVDEEARYRHPISPGQQPLGEEHLILYYQGRIAWEDLYPDPEDPLGGMDESDKPSVDERPGVDTSRIQSYQVREFVEALKGIHDDLKSASTHPEPAMRLALLGPVSPVALGRAVMEGVDRDRKSPIAAGFQLVEIMACLRAARGYALPQEHKKAWLGLLDHALGQIETYLQHLHKAYPDRFAKRGAFSRYERKIRHLHRVEKSA